jgi:hypothetical protein
VLLILSRLLQGTQNVESPRMPWPPPFLHGAFGIGFAAFALHIIQTHFTA